MATYVRMHNLHMLMKLKQFYSQLAQRTIDFIYLRKYWMSLLLFLQMRDEMVRDVKSLLTLWNGTNQLPWFYFFFPMMNQHLKILKKKNIKKAKNDLKGNEKLITWLYTALLQVETQNNKKTSSPVLLEIRWTIKVDHRRFLGNFMTFLQTPILLMLFCLIITICNRIQKIQ